VSALLVATALSHVAHIARGSIALRARQSAQGTRMGSGTRAAEKGLDGGESWTRRLYPGAGCFILIRGALPNQMAPALVSRAYFKAGHYR
jgi:hypothetical protein